MPLYEYQCDACGRRFEIIQKFADAPATVCRLCGQGPVERLVSSPAIQFKGSGWYITDYAQKSKSDGGKSEGAADGTKTPAGGDAKKTSDAGSTPTTSSTPSTAASTASSPSTSKD